MRIFGVGLCILSVALFESFGFALQPSSSDVDEISLEQAMDLAGERLISVQLSEAALEESQQKWKQTLATMLPRVDLDANQMWLPSSVYKAAGTTLGSQYIPNEVRSAAISIFQPLTSLFPLLFKLHADFINTEVALREEAQSKREGRFTGAEAFLRAQKADEILKVAEQSLALVKKQHSDGASLARAGKLNNSDIMLLDLALAEINVQVTQLRSAKELAYILLAEAIGHTDSKSIKLAILAEKPDQHEVTSADANTPPIDEALQAAKLNRPDVFSAEKRIAIAKDYKMASDFDYIPTVAAVVKYERDFLARPISIPQQSIYYSAQDVQNKLTYGLNVKWNLWDWGSRYFRSSELAATIRKAELAKQGIESKLRVEVAQALSELGSASEIQVLAHAAVRAAEEGYRLASLRFKNGSISTTELISAERDQTRARGNMVSAHNDFYLAKLKLQKVTGLEPRLNK